MSIAKPISPRNFSIAVLSISLKPSTVLTSSGTGCSITSVVGLSKLASRASTGFITYFLTASNSLSDTSPVSTYTFALRTNGRSFCVRIEIHSSALAARWSNCPGKYSTANTFPSFISTFSSYALSTGGSEKIRFLAFAYSSSVTPDTS